MQAGIDARQRIKRTITSVAFRRINHAPTADWDGSRYPRQSTGSGMIPGFSSASNRCVCLCVFHAHALRGGLVGFTLNGASRATWMEMTGGDVVHVLYHPTSLSHVNLIVCPRPSRLQLNVCICTNDEAIRLGPSRPGPGL